MIVVIGGIKGGSGKTTIATNLTVMRSMNKKVLLVDADEQKSASSWAQQREMEGRHTPWATIQLAGPTIRSQIQKMHSDYDDIIIDVGGRDTTTQRSALTIADVYVVPFKPRSLDIWTLASVKTLISEIAAINEKLKSYGLINMGDAVGADNIDALEILKECPNLVCLPGVVGQRKAFANAATEGMGVIEMKIQDKKAIAEMTALYDCIYHYDRE